MGHGMGLGPGREFDLIRRIVGDDPLAREVRVGPGDDAAVLSDGWVLSTDLSVEDVHFRRSWLSDAEIGYRAAAGALSDLAAMAAEPVGVLVSCAAPRSVDVEAVNVGVREVVTSVGASVIGGDLARSPGPLTIDIVVLGRTDWPVRRSGAEPGDHVWVTGRLGAAAAAVGAWQGGGQPTPSARRAFARPTPRVLEARCLVEYEIVDAMIDLSDGLAGDAGHLAAASNVAIALEADRIPLADDLLDLDPTEALELALRGGEDFELCFVTDPDAVDADDFRARFGVDVTRVGTVSEGEGLWLLAPDGRRERLEGGGYDHWSEGEA